MPYFKADGSPLEHDLIVATMVTWSLLPTLNPAELSLVEHLRDAAAEGPEPFQEFVSSIPPTFLPVLIIAITKARIAGVGRYAD